MTEVNRKAVIVLVLIVLVAAVFLQVGSHPFIRYDDYGYVVDNPHVQSGLTFEGVVWAFTTTEMANWHPVTWLSLMTDVSAFGANAGRIAGMNVLIHCLNSVLLFLVLGAMTGKSWQSGFVAALFAIHPLHVESVAWVSERKDVLSALFMFLALGAYLRYVRCPRTRNYLPIVLFFALGLMSKPMLVTLPLVLLLMDYWPLGRFRPFPGTADDAAWGVPPQPWMRLVLEKIPLLILAGASSAVTYLAQNGGGMVVNLREIPLGARCANALLAYVSYLGETAWPSRLSVFYPFPANAIPAWKVVGAGLLLCGATALVVRQARRLPWLAVGWFWYLGTLVPVIGLVQVGSQAMADRYTYLPLVGIFIAVVWGAAELAKFRKIPKWVTVPVAMAGLAVLALCSWVQTGYWIGTIPLFTHALEVTRDNYLAHAQLGNEASHEGRDEDALRHYMDAFRLRSDDSNLRYALYSALSRLGKMEEAMQYFNAGLRASVSTAEAQNEVGLSFAESGKIEEAAACFREAIRVRPDYPEAHYNLGVALWRLGRKDEATTHFRDALKIRPTDAEAHNKIGVSLARLGRLAEAESQFREALRLRPEHAEARYNLKMTLERLGKGKEAIHEYEEALRVVPGDRDPADALQNALSKKRPNGALR